MKKLTSKSALFSSSCVLAIGLLSLTGCSDNTVSTGENSSASASAAQDLKVSDAWAKAAQSGMTAVFGEVTNTSDHDITITGAHSNATDAANTQLHTTEMDSSGSSQMKQVESFTIPAGETLTLKPGADHIMLMDLTCSLPAGTNVKVTLETEDGKEMTFDAGARDYSGAKEEYAPGEEGSEEASESHESMEGMDHEHMNHEHMDHEHMNHENMDHSEHSGHDMGSMDSSESADLPQCS